MRAQNDELQPVVSVCIANYNGEKLLDECIESVLSQDFGGDVEILVHDDASTDASLRVLEERYAGIVVIPSTVNVGYCVSNNRLAARARGQYLLLLNNDATLRQGALRALVTDAALRRAPFALTLAQYDRRSGALVDLGVRLDLLHTPVANHEVNCRRLAYVQGACLFIRRDDWFRLGGFPEWMQSNAEDAYLCALVRLHGGAIGVVGGSGYDHLQGASFGGNRLDNNGLSTTYRRRYLSERNRASMVFVCTPGATSWFFYAMQVVVLLVEGALLSLLKLDWKLWRTIYWAAARDSLGMLGRLRAARRRAQSGRKIGLWSYLRILDPIPHKLVMFIKYGLPQLK